MFNKRTDPQKMILFGYYFLCGKSDSKKIVLRNV